MLEPIMPPDIDDVLGLKEITKAIRSSLNAAAQGAKVDFMTTTRTWDERVEFTIESPTEESRVVRTDNPKYQWTDKGTEPHIIRPKRAGGRLSIIGINSRPKTRPGFIGSVKGGRDNTNVYTKQVNHPGTKAREFSVAIRDKWAKQMVIIMAIAMENAAQKARRG